MRSCSHSFAKHASSTLNSENYDDNYGNDGDNDLMDDYDDNYGNDGDNDLMDDYDDMGDSLDSRHIFGD